MKTTLSFIPSRRHASGVALVIVLAMLVLLSALLVAFMTTASIEKQATVASANVTSARQLADSTVSLVISQIRDATTDPDITTTWASQPGAIRTFSGQLNGQTKPLLDKANYDIYTPGGKDMVFKLYSADRLAVTSGTYVDNDLVEDVSVIEKWNPLDATANTKAFPDYVDLNQPILLPRPDLDSKGTTVEPHFPIIDPRAKLNVDHTDTEKADPGMVDGFDAKITRDANLKMPKPLLPDGNTGISAAVPYLPMPVKWLYVLRDGTIGPASLGTDANPIVGRTAFWTDDETCKLNINTASEGTFWDSPLVSSKQECGSNSGSGGVLNSVVDYGMYFAASQPAKGEIMRYPGHPATTCLSPVLGQLLKSKVLPMNGGKSTGTWTYPWLTGGAMNIPYRDFKDQLYQMLPFMAHWEVTPNSPGGTSYSSTRNTDHDATDDGWQAIKTKHLFASVDDLLFKPNKVNGAPADLNSPLTAEGLEKTRFFLTTNSRAPELNLFSRPRVTLWPVAAVDKYRTSYDDLFIFASTIYKDPTALSGAKDKRYCLLRWDGKSNIRDYDGKWENTGDASKYQTDQNTIMYDYLQRMTDLNVPGYGGNFHAKWPEPDSSALSGMLRSDRDEVLTMIFDYVRSINLVDTGTTNRGSNVFVPYTPLFYGGKKDVMYDPRNSRSSDWSGQVTPLRVPFKNSDDVNDPKLFKTTTQGMGRFVTPTEVAMIFYGTTGAAQKIMKCALAIEMETVMPGFPGLRDTYWTVVRPPNSDIARPTKIKFKAAQAQPEIATNLCSKPLINVVNMSSHEIGFGRAFMPTMGFRNQMHYFTEWSKPTLMQFPPEANDPAKPANPDYTSKTKIFRNDAAESKGCNTPNKIGPNGYVRSKTVAIYPYVSDGMNIPAGATGFTLTAGNFDIEIWSGEAPDDPRSTLVQLVHVDFPSVAVDLPVPTSTQDLPSRLDQNLDGNWNNVIINGDVVRSMELTCGFDNTDATKAGLAADVRLAAVLPEVPSSYFAPRDGLTAYKSTTALIHGMHVGHGDAYTGYTGSGKIALNGALERKPPHLAKLANGVLRKDGGPGDFDKGISKHNDGSFGNKVDEGNLHYDYGANPPQSVPYFLGRSIEETGQTFFTPNRQICSAVMLGSIPTGAYRGLPWQTLLFHPSREPGVGHPGTGRVAGQKGPPDHLILDLFTIPVVEPYAISEPFSTAGKVNMNYVIAPFGYAKGDPGTNTDTANPRSYLRRDTALRGVLKSEFIMAVPTGQPEAGHAENPLTDNGGGVNFRFPINMNRTIEAMETRLKAKDGQYPLFRSASEICTVDLYPYLKPPSMSATVTDWESFWNKDYALTGDNGRERPYAHIYPRLTTKSNVYTVYMRTQAIKKGKNSRPDEFDPVKDAVVGEYRGSATIERFIDPNDSTLKDYNDKKDKVDAYYRYRVVSTKHFSPK